MTQNRCCLSWWTRQRLHILCLYQKTMTAVRCAIGAGLRQERLAVALMMFAPSVVASCGIGGPPVYYAFQDNTGQVVQESVLAAEEYIESVAGCDFIYNVPLGNQDFTVEVWDECYGGQARYGGKQIFLPSALCPYHWVEMAAHEIMHILGHYGHDDVDTQPTSLMRPHLNGPKMSITLDDTIWLKNKFCEGGE